MWRFKGCFCRLIDGKWSPLNILTNMCISIHSFSKICISVTSLSLFTSMDNLDFAHQHMIFPFNASPYLPLGKKSKLSDLFHSPPVRSEVKASAGSWRGFRSRLNHFTTKDMILGHRTEGHFFSSLCVHALWL